jgi:hypothetical protein
MRLSPCKALPQVLFDSWLLLAANKGPSSFPILDGFQFNLSTLMESVKSLGHGIAWMSQR